MSFFDDILALDAASFVDPEMMPGVERITYRPLGNSGSDVTIYADVFRADSLLPTAGIPLVATPKLTIFVKAANVATPQKGDVFVIPEFTGSTVTKPHQFSRVLKSDAGGFLLELL